MKKFKILSLHLNSEECSFTVEDAIILHLDSNLLVFNGKNGERIALGDIYSNNQVNINSIDTLSYLVCEDSSVEIEISKKRLVSYCTKLVDDLLSQSHSMEYFLEEFKEQLPREYSESLPNFGDLIPIKDFMAGVHCQGFMLDDGDGYYVKDNLYYKEKTVWQCQAEDATHVIWFNK